MKSQCLLLVLVLAGCQPAPDHSTYTATERVHRQVTVIPTQRVASICAEVIGMSREQAYITPPKACTHWDDDACTIYIPYEADHAMLGHEMRHCLYGNFHR